MGPHEPCSFSPSDRSMHRIALCCLFRPLQPPRERTYSTDKRIHLPLAGQNWRRLALHRADSTKPQCEHHAFRFSRDKLRCSPESQGRLRSLRCPPLPLPCVGCQLASAMQWGESPTPIDHIRSRSQGMHIVDALVQVASLYLRRLPRTPARRLSLSLTKKLLSHIRVNGTRKLLLTALRWERLVEGTLLRSAGKLNVLSGQGFQSSPREKPSSPPISLSSSRHARVLGFW